MKASPRLENSDITCDGSETQYENSDIRSENLDRSLVGLVGPHTWSENSDTRLEHPDRSPVSLETRSENSDISAG